MKNGEFAEARAAYLVDDSHEKRIAKDVAYEADKTAIREFYRDHVRENPLMSAEDRSFLGHDPVDTTKTPSPIPTTYPVSHFDLNTQRQIGVTSEDSASGHKTKPDGVDRADHAWLVLPPGASVPEPMPDPKTFGNFTSWTKPREPCILNFTEPQRRGAILHASRWVNTTSQPGPWSPIEVITIP
jgi:hypothetical protein